jgi:hypothetical protein
MAEQLLRFIEMFRGSSFPTLSETTTGQQRVVKMRGAGNGAGALVSEFVVNRLAHAVALPAPDAFIVQIPTGFPWAFGSDEFHDLVQKSGGSNLALEWLGPATPLPEVRYNSLPHDFVSQVVTIDRVFANFDRSVKSGNLLEDSDRRLWIVDHGSCRFLSGAVASVTPALPAGHIFAGWEDAFESRWLKPITSSLIAETVAEIPPEWLAETQLSRTDIIDSIEVRLKFVH